MPDTNGETTRGKILTKEAFTSIIEGLVKDKQISYLEAIVMHLEETGLDSESVPKLISQSIKDELENEFVNLHLLKRKTVKIPLKRS